MKKKIYCCIAFICLLFNSACNDNVVSETNVSCNEGEAPQAGLIGYYPFDGDVEDFSGNELHGTNNNAGFVDSRNCRDGKALYIPGNQITQFVTLPTSLLLGEQNVSVSFWTKLDDITSVNISPFINAEAALAFEYDFTTGDFTAVAGNVPSPLDTIEYSSTLLNDLGWHHLVYVRNDGVLDIYGDGELIGSGNMVNDNVISNAGGCIIIGQELDDFTCGSLNPAQSLNGAIDEIYFYNRALTESEVQQLYNM